MILLHYLKRIITLGVACLTGPTIKLLNDPQARIDELKQKYGKNILFLLWHENISAPVYFYRHKGLGLLREASLKGDDFAFCVRRFGYKEFGVTDNLADPVSAKGTVQFIRYLREGHDGNIALDGPNGPYHQPKPGVFKIAEKAKLIIVPAGVWYSHKIVLKKRWDKFQWPLPFTKWYLEFGEPIVFPENIDDKEKLQENLNKLRLKMEEVNKLAQEKGLGKTGPGSFFKFSQAIKKIFLIITYYVTGLTGKMANDPEPRLKELKSNGKNLLFAVWHESTAGCFWYYRWRKAAILREDSSKGEVLAAMSRHFGYKDFKITDNPNDRVSAKGTIQFIKYLREGHDGVVALDGPNGPYYEPKPGVFAIAQKSNSQVIPVGVWYSHKIILKNRWDKYQIPLPFSKTVLLVGDPIEASEKMDEATLAGKLKELTEKIVELNKKAEEIGRL
jgi:lysophospholipid acyltransferase (LPLAT)-like uncharacterized protein